MREREIMNTMFGCCVVPSLGLATSLWAHACPASVCVCG